MKQRLGHGSVNYHKNREKWQRLSCRWRWALVCWCVRGWGVIQNKTYLMAPPTFFNPSTVYSTPSPILEPAFRTALPMLAAEKVCWSMLMLRPLSSPNFGQPSWLMMLRSNGSTLYEANLLRSWKTQAQVEIRIGGRRHKNGWVKVCKGSEKRRTKPRKCLVIIKLCVVDYH